MAGSDYAVLTISMCHTDWHIIEASLEQYYRTREIAATRHVLVDQHWPIEYSFWRSQLERIARRFGCELVDPGENLGLHRGFNFALDSVAWPDTGGVIGYDPDSYPVTQGWDRLLAEEFVRDSNAVWLSAWHQHARRQVVEEGAGEEIRPGTWRVKRPVMNSICMFRMGWLRRVGGLYEQNALYGGLECDMWPKIAPSESWLFLEQVVERPEFESWVHPLYREWKWRTAHTKEVPHTMSFEKWLRARASLP